MPTSWSRCGIPGWGMVGDSRHAVMLHAAANLPGLRSRMLRTRARVQPCVQRLRRPSTSGRGCRSPHCHVAVNRLHAVSTWNVMSKWHLLHCRDKSLPALRRIERASVLESFASSTAAQSKQDHDGQDPSWAGSRAKMVLLDAEHGACSAWPSWLRLSVAAEDAGFLDLRRWNAG